MRLCNSQHDFYMISRESKFSWFNDFPVFGFRPQTVNILRIGCWFVHLENTYHVFPNPFLFAHNRC